MMEGLDEVTSEWEELYRQISPEGKPTPLLVQPVVVTDGPPSEEEIADVVWIRHAGRAGGP